MPDNLNEILNHARANYMNEENMNFRNNVVAEEPVRAEERNEDLDFLLEDDEVEEENEHGDFNSRIYDNFNSRVNRDKAVINMGEFIKGQKVHCPNLYTYNGNKLQRDTVYTVNLVGRNVISVDEITNDNGEPLKFFKKYFANYVELSVPLLRIGDKVQYSGSLCVVHHLESDIATIKLINSNRPAFNINLKSDRSVYYVMKQYAKKKDKITLIDLRHLAQYRDDDHYYIGGVCIKNEVLEQLYMDLEEKEHFVVSKSYSNGDYVNIKGYPADVFIPCDIILISEFGTESRILKKGASVVFKKGNELTIGETYKVNDIVQLSGKTIIGIKTDTSLVYVNFKQFKLKANEKEVVKEKC